MIGEEAVVKEEKGGVKDEGETRHSGTLTFVAVSISVTSDYPGIFLSTRSHTHTLTLSVSPPLSHLCPFIHHQATVFISVKF